MVTNGEEVGECNNANLDYNGDLKISCNQYGDIEVEAEVSSCFRRCRPGQVFASADINGEVMNAPLGEIIFHSATFAQHCSTVKFGYVGKY